MWAPWLRGASVLPFFAGSIHSTCICTISTIYILATITAIWNTPLLIAPFGASCVLLFALPQSPLAQPRNVIGGHLLSSAIGLIVLSVLGTSPIAYGLAVGLAIAAMQMTDTLHPPAGADTIIVILAGASWQFLLIPVLAGTTAIAMINLLSSGSVETVLSAQSLITMRCAIKNISHPL